VFGVCVAWTNIVLYAANAVRYAAVNVERQFSIGQAKPVRDCRTLTGTPHDPRRFLVFDSTVASNQLVSWEDPLKIVLTFPSSSFIS